MQALWNRGRHKAQGRGRPRRCWVCCACTVAGLAELNEDLARIRCLRTGLHTSIASIWYTWRHKALTLYFVAWTGTGSCAPQKRASIASGRGKTPPSAKCHGFWVENSPVGGCAASRAVHSWSMPDPVCGGFFPCQRITDDALRLSFSNAHAQCRSCREPLSPALSSATPDGAVLLLFSFAVCCDAGSFHPHLHCLVTATVTSAPAVALAPQQSPSRHTRHVLSASLARHSIPTHLCPPGHAPTFARSFSFCTHPHTDTHNGFGAANMAALAGREHRPEVRTDYEQGPIRFPSMHSTAAAAA